MSAPNLRAVPRTAPAQPGLPLPAPPDRPFVSLARETHIGGGPVRKLVYLVLASYCPVMTKAWAARGNPHRETLQRVCEIGRIRTLDTHLAALRADGWISWTRQGRGHASEFEVRLAPIQAAIQGGQELHPECNSTDLRVALSGRKSCTLRAEELHSECKHKAAEDHGSDLQQQQEQAPSAPEGTGAPVQHDAGRESDPPPAPTTAQIDLLEVCADRLNATMPGDRLLARVDRRAVQQQIAIAKRMRVSAGDFKHKHKADAEVLVDSGADNGIQWREVMQRCPCGAVRYVTLHRDGAETEVGEWVLCSLLATAFGDGDYLAGDDVEPGDTMLSGWRQPYTWSETKRQTKTPWKCRGCGAETADFPGSGCEGCGGTVFNGGER